MNTDQIALINMYLQVGYVFLTLVLVIITLKALFSTGKQAREALFNQHKPVLVPRGLPISTDAIVLTMRIENKGAGVAVNTWGVIAMPRGKLPGSNVESNAMRYCAEESHFLAPDQDSEMTFKIGSGLLPDKVETFAGYSLYPPKDTKKIPALYRLMITYKDAFNNKWLVVFDYTTELGWRQVDEIERVKQSLDELVVAQNPLNQWIKQTTGKSK